MGTSSSRQRQNERSRRHIRVPEMQRQVSHYSEPHSEPPILIADNWPFRSTDESDGTIDADMNDDLVSSVSKESEKVSADSCAVTTNAKVDIDAGLCKICLDHEYDMVAIPCGHLGVCQDCCNRLWKEDKPLVCPFCNKKDVKFYRVFRS